MIDFYTIKNEGRCPFLIRNGRVKGVTIKPGETVEDVPLTDELAFILFKRKDFRFSLTEKQAARMNTPQEKKPESKPEDEVKRMADGKHAIPSDWKTKPWGYRKKLAIELNAGHNVTNAKQANAIIEAEIAKRG